MSLSPIRRQYDFCRYRLYRPVTKCVFYLNTYIQQHTTYSKTMSIKQWRHIIRSVQKTDTCLKEFLTIFHTEEPDYIKILHLGICALESLSGLCRSDHSSVNDHSYSIWTFVCRVYYENPHHFFVNVSPRDHVAYLRVSVDKFLSEQCNISDGSSCPTTITATNYRLDCLLHKLESLSHIFYEAMLESNRHMREFQRYIESHCETDPSYIISHILTAYSYLLGTTTHTVVFSPLRDGQSIQELFDHLLYVALLEPGILDRTKTNGREIICIQEELPMFITRLFSTR